MKYKSRFSKYVTWLVLFFFYLPMVVMTINSFNNSKYGITWKGFTLQWYIDMFNNPKILFTLMNSLIIGVTAMLVSMILGSLAAFCIHYYRTRLQLFHNNLILIQLGVPDILMGMSLLLFFISIHLKLGLLTIFFAHVTFCISYVTMVVLARLQNFDFSILEAAKDLGASWPVIIRKIILPLLSPGIIAGGLLAFTLSIDDFVITFFVTGPGSTTLPVYIYSMMKHGNPTVVNAISVFIFIATFILVFFTQKLTDTKKK
ncbi:MAG TPA: spermidine/putrescine ABC transporter permease [Lentisphaeria bacterium]|nr:MAG: spermidine/putrescine ABC transporter permease [Lentisphaerae bacterium GWF2_38_69]HBM15685.1 spermidine/putrescine ABC transporter permease [Lentisphaeria bacterium]